MAVKNTAAPLAIYLPAEDFFRLEPLRTGMVSKPRSSAGTRGGTGCGKGTSRTGVRTGPCALLCTACGERVLCGVGRCVICRKGGRALVVFCGGIRLGGGADLGLISKSSLASFACLWASRSLSFCKYSCFQSCGISSSFLYCKYAVRYLLSIVFVTSSCNAEREMELL